MMELSLQEDILQNNEDRSSDEIKVEGEILTWDTLWFEVCSSGEQIKYNKETINICSETDSSDQVICSTEIKKDDASLSIQNKNDDQNIEEITAVTTKGTSIDIPDVDVFSEAKITTGIRDEAIRSSLINNDCVTNQDTSVKTRKEKDITEDQISSRKKVREIKRSVFQIRNQNIKHLGQISSTSKM